MKKVNGIIKAPSSPERPQGSERTQKGMDEVFMPRVSTETLIKLDHADWLENFAKVMRMQTGIEMTPMRAGVISRCNLAAEYIRYLQTRERMLGHDLDLAMKEIARLKKREGS